MLDSALVGFLFLFSVSVFFVYFAWYAKEYWCIDFTMGRGKEKKDYKYDHKILRTIIMVFIFHLLLFGASLYDESTRDCEWLVQNTTLTDVNTSTYNHTYQCAQSPENHVDTFWQLVQLILIVVYCYFILILLLKIVEWIRRVIW